MNYNISFKFDDNTRQVYDVKVQTEGEPEVQPIREETIELKNTSLQLTAGVLTDLHTLRQGSKIALVFEPKGVVKLVNPKLYPVNSAGSTLSGKFTISVKGKNQKALSEIGTQFFSQRVQPGVVLLIPQEVEEAEVGNPDTCGEEE